MKKSRQLPMVAPTDYPGPTWNGLPRWVQVQRNWWLKNQDVIGLPSPDPVWDDEDPLSEGLHRLHDALVEAQIRDPKPPPWWVFDDDKVTQDVAEAWLKHVRCPVCEYAGSADWGSDPWTLECLDCEGTWTPDWVTPWGPPTPKAEPRRYTKGECVICGKSNRRMNPAGPYSFVCHPKRPDDIEMGHGWGGGWIDVLNYQPPDWDALRAWAETSCATLFFRDFQLGYYRYLPVSFRFCYGCGAFFAARLDDQDYCSRECGPMPPKYALRLREMASKASPGFRRVDVFDRDGWTCHICGEPVDRDSADPLSRASLDHVVPIARGGLHTLENVKCAHLRCNIRKSDDVWVGKEAVGLRTSLRAEVKRSQEPLEVPLGWDTKEVFDAQSGVEALRNFVENQETKALQWKEGETPFPP